MKKFTKPKKFDANIVIIGAGSAGLVAAIIAAGAKAKVILIEKHKMGGDCLNTGCVPSKSLIRSGRMMAYLRRAKEYGIEGKLLVTNIVSEGARVIKVVPPFSTGEIQFRDNI